MAKEMAMKAYLYNITMASKTGLQNSQLEKSLPKNHATHKRKEKI